MGVNQLGYLVLDVSNLDPDTKAPLSRLLLDRYGNQRSFVRDSSWTLILGGG